jgi:type III secretory pathway component EscU
LLYLSFFTFNLFFTFFYLFLLCGVVDILFSRFEILKQPPGSTYNSIQFSIIVSC